MRPEGFAVRTLLLKLELGELPDDVTPCLPSRVKA